MGLIINEEACENESPVLQDINIFLQKYTKHFHEKAESLKKRKEFSIDSSHASLYISQREYATVSSKSKIKLIGSDMATTCHLVVLQCGNSEAVSFGHFDGTSTEDGVRDMLTDLMNCSDMIDQQLDGTKRSYTLQMAGGYDDENSRSSELSLELLKAFHKASDNLGVDVRLIAFCCSAMNSKLITCKGQQIPSPVVFGLALNMRTGVVFPASFDEDAKTPVIGLRGALSLLGDDGMRSIFDWASDQLKIEPFELKPFPNAMLWLQQSPSTIRKYMSTSPDVEPPQFYTAICRSLSFIVSNPDPMETVFKGNRPLQFNMVNNVWVQNIHEEEKFNFDDLDDDELPDLIPGDAEDD